MTDIETMQAFFKSELSTLHIKTGVDQAGWLVRECKTKEEAVKLIDTCTLQWANVVCEKPFDLISCDAKKRIIYDNMIKDVAFTKVPYGELPGFNNRILNRWMDAHWRIHGDVIEKKSEKQQEKIIPASPEVAEKYLNEWKQSLVGISEGYKNIDDEMKKIKLEDMERQEGKKAIKCKSTTQEEIELRERKLEAARKRGIDKLDFKDLKTFEIEGQRIISRTQEEAQEIYIEVYEN